MKTPKRSKYARGPSRFRKTETARLFRAAHDAGWDRIMCDPATGRIMCFRGPPESNEAGDPWGERLAKNAENQKRTA